MLAKLPRKWRKLLCRLSRHHTHLREVPISQYVVLWCPTCEVVVRYKSRG